VEAILLGIMGLVVGFGIGYWRFASPLQRKITAIERAKSRVESANEGIKAENQQLQAQLLQNDANYKRRLQSLEQSHQAQLDALQAQVDSPASSLVSSSPDETASALATEARRQEIEELNAQHQAEISAYQQQIQELQTSLSNAIATPLAPPTPEPNRGAALMTGLAGGVAGVVAGVGLADLLSPQEDVSLPKPPEAQEQQAVVEPETLLEPETLSQEFALVDDRTSPETLALPEIPALEENVPIQGSAPAELIPPLDEPVRTEEISPEISGFATDQSWVPPVYPEPETLDESPDFETLDLAQLLDDSSATAPTFDLDPATEEPDLFELNIAELLPSDDPSVLPVPEESTTQDAINWLDHPALEEDRPKEDLPSFFTETETDPFANLFDTDSPDLAFLELLQTQEEPFAFKDENSETNPFASLGATDSSASDWDFGDLLPTEEDHQHSDFNLADNNFDEGLDELFDSLSLSEEK
jgi:hypothetical protein